MAEGQVTDTDPITGDPTSVAGPPKKQEMPDPYTQYQQEQARKDATAAQIQGMREDQMKLATGLPRTPPPNVKDVPPPPQQQYQNVFKEAMNPLIFLTAMGAGMMSKNHGMGAMKAATGFMEGFQEGDAKRINLEQKNWENNLKALTENNKNAIDRYNAVLHNNSLTAVERQAQIGIIAAQIGDKIALEQMKSGDYGHFNQRLNAIDRGTTQLMRQQGAFGLLNQDVREALNKAGWNDKTIETYAVNYNKMGPSSLPKNLRQFGAYVTPAIINRADELLAETGTTSEERTKNWQLYKAEQQAINSFLGSGKRGDIVTSLNTVTQHARTLQEAAKALQGNDMPLFRQIAQGIATATGKPEPGNFQQVASILGTEIVRALGVAGAGTHADRIAQEIKASTSPAGIEGRIHELQILLAGRLAALRGQFVTTTKLPGEKFDEQLFPATREFLAQERAGAGTAPPSRPGAGQPASGQPQVGEVRTNKNGVKAKWTGQGWEVIGNAPAQ